MDLLHWFSGGEHQYMTLRACMGRDDITVWIVVGECVAIVIGYLLIALKWHRSAKNAKPGPTRSALTTMKWIFVCCALCGYGVVPVKLFWAAWRLHAILLCPLLLSTYAYLLFSKGTWVIYTELATKESENQSLRRELASIRTEVSDFKARLQGMGFDPA